ncbi:MAG: lysylphosphatidylglycerol synthase transmembrane domain-containing protein [Anaerolineales bacterium]
MQNDEFYLPTCSLTLSLSLRARGHLPTCKLATCHLHTSSSPLRRLLYGLLFGFLVILAMTLFSDVQQVGEQVRAFRWAYLPVVLALTLFNYLLRGFKFHYYLRQIGARLPLRESFRLFVAGFPLAVTPGKAGEALKGVWIEQQSGVPAARGVSVVVAERISDGLAVLLLSTLGVIAYPQYWPGFAFVLSILLGIIIVSQIRPLAEALLGFGKRLPLVSRFVHHLHEFYEGSFTLFRPQATLLAVGLGMVSWLGEGIGFFVVLHGLGLPADVHTLSIAVFTLAFSTVIGAASALPGGLGAAEASIAGMLVLLLDISQETAAAATLLIRFATLWFGVALGLGTWAFSHHRLGIRREQNE